jgi:hypothetical protein
MGAQASKRERVPDALQSGLERIGSRRTRLINKSASHAAVVQSCSTDPQRATAIRAATSAHRVRDTSDVTSMGVGMSASGHSEEVLHQFDSPHKDPISNLNRRSPTRGCAAYGATRVAPRLLRIKSSLLPGRSPVRERQPLSSLSPYECSLRGTRFETV